MGDAVEAVEAAEAAKAAEEAEEAEEAEAASSIAPPFFALVGTLSFDFFKMAD